MSLLSVNDLSKTYGLHTLWTDLCFSLNVGERLGIIGPNGVGKSTLLACLAGRLAPDTGEIIWRQGAEFAYLPQDLQGQAALRACTVGEALQAALGDLAGHEAKLRAEEEALARASGEALPAALRAYQAALDAYEALGGYTAEAEAEKILAGLGVDALPHEQTLATLSGGEKTRLGLALLLMSRADVLLLDEPTTHLDRAALAWLEDFIAGWAGAVVLVSHDRAFLNATATQLLALEEGQAPRLWRGDYDSYQAEQSRARRQWEADFAAQTEEKRALRAQIQAARTHTRRTVKPRDNDKFIPQIGRETASHTASRHIAWAEERLKRLEEVAIARPPKPLVFKTAFHVGHSPNPISLVVEGLSQHYNGRSILDGLSFDLRRGARVAITGENGAGKSTLMRLLAGELSPQAGAIRWAGGLRLGYLAQESAPPQGRASWLCIKRGVRTKAAPSLWQNYWRRGFCAMRN